MRGRAWRRYQQDLVFIRRLKLRIGMSNYWRFKDVNHISINKITISSLVNHKDSHMYKSYVTTRYDSRYKSKYSSNRGGYYRDKNKIGNRESDKVKFLRILKENGIN